MSSNPSASGLVDGDVVAGRYRVVRELGRGGMGTVYEVEQIGTGMRLAMKCLRRDLGQDTTIARRFEREAKAASLLSHPGIVETLDFGVLPDGSMFLVMELARGVALGDLIDSGQVDLPRALAIARQLLEALAHAHGQGIIHRDIKADNVMVDGDRVRLLDFGIAKVVGEAAAAVGGDKLTQAGVTFGTPDYMAPEQALGQEVDGRADLYAVGVLLFEMITGRRPFDDPDAMEVVRKQIVAPAPSLSSFMAGRILSPALESVVARALAKKRDDRFANAGEMIAALDEVVRPAHADRRAATAPVAQTSPPRPPPGARNARNLADWRWWAAAFAAACLLLLVLSLIAD